jgi:ferrochelatase
MAAAGLGEKDWYFAFQSQGVSGGPWIGPTVEETLKAIKEEGRVGVVIQPVGFLCDHVEILYDIDIAFRELASELGLKLWRAESLNDSVTLVRALMEVVSGEYKATVDDVTVPAGV